MTDEEKFFWKVLVAVWKYEVWHTMKFDVNHWKSMLRRRKISTCMEVMLKSTYDRLY